MTAARKVRILNRPSWSNGKARDFACSQYPASNARESTSNPEISRTLKGVLPEDFQHVGQQGDTGPKEDQSHRIQRVCLLPVIRQVQIDENQADQTDGNVEKEDHPPVKIADNQTARDGSEHGSNQGRYRNEAHGAEKIGFRKRPHQGEPAYGHHHGAAAALQDAAGNEYMDVARYAA